MISFLGTEDRVIYSILKTHSQNDFEKKMNAEERIEEHSENSNKELEDIKKREQSRTEECHNRNEKHTRRD